MGWSHFPSPCPQLETLHNNELWLFPIATQTGWEVISEINPRFCLDKYSQKMNVWFSVYLFKEEFLGRGFVSWPFNILLLDLQKLGSGQQGSFPKSSSKHLQWILKKVSVGREQRSGGFWILNQNWMDIFIMINWLQPAKLNQHKRFGKNGKQ